MKSLKSLHTVYPVTYTDRTYNSTKGGVSGIT